MKKKSASAVTTENAFKVSGIVRDQSQQPLSDTIVRVYEKQLRRKQQLGESVTDSSGKYTIDYTLKNDAAIAIIVGIYDSKKKLLKESNVYHQPAASLEINIDLSGKPLAGISEFEQLTKTISPFTNDIPLSQVTENDKEKDISFISENTKLPRETIERLAMAARFETYSVIGAQLWYGMLQEILADFSPNENFASLRSENFEARLAASFDKLMHTSADILVSRIQSAVDKNIIAHKATKELSKIREQLDTQQLAYAKAHPVSGAPSELYQKAELGGLKGKELESFLAAHNNHTDQHENFWKQIKEHPELKNSEHLEKTEAVFHLSQLTGDDLSLIEHLINEEKITSRADIRKLAKYDRSDWETTLKKAGTKREAKGFAKSSPSKKQDAAAQLESSFTKAFPTASFAAHLEKDAKSKLPHKDKINKFLNQNEHFDLLKSRVGKFLEENKNAVEEKDAPELAGHLRRIQRVLKLAPTYNAAHTLLGDNIHSAQQVSKMGEDNFVKTYADRLGKEEAREIFKRADTVHATAVVLMGNLTSMSDASSLNVFPDFAQSISQTLSQELPSLETLFGHTDFFATDESRSVYGAPAYLTDILHFLDKRNSTLPLTGTKIPSVKDLLLKRRPDIADIDLESNNTNIEVPYIDIACEVMEDFIAAPISAMFSNTLLPKLVKGPIDSALLINIQGAFTSSGQSGFGNLLTASATVSDKFTSTRLQEDNTYITQDHWIIRDSLITIKVTNLGTGLQCRALHQTLLSTKAINAGSEYVNTRVYDNFLKTAKLPFNLPFDLFETEGELYLEKLGVKKADLIDAFRKEDKLAAGSSPADLGAAYASLGINEAEQTLIFAADATHQSLYWGTVASGTTVQIDVFEKLTGLNYSQINNLIQLQFINPLKDSFIEHDDLLSDTTKQRITNLTAAKFDAIHRFLRLWRKTTLTMDELDAIIMSNIIGQGKITGKLAWQLNEFISLQHKLQLNVFQLLAFYQNIDTTHNLPNCLYNQLFQNNAITNPVSANFSITATTPGTLAINESDKAVIAAVLQVSIAEVNALIAKTFSRIAFPALSSMYRNVLLARALELSLSDFFSLLNLIDANPFLDVHSTTLFLQKFQLLKSSGFGIDELNYVLRHQDNASQSLVPSVSNVTAALNQLQNDLLAARTVALPVPDNNGAVLIKWLSDPIFKWDSRLLSQLINILNTVDDEEYKQNVDNNSNFLLNLRMQYHDAVLTVNLPALPLTSSGIPIAFPSSIVSQLFFDTGKKQLSLIGYMNQPDRDALLALVINSTDPNASAYQTAVTTLYNLSQQTDSSASNTFFTNTTDIALNLKSILSTRVSDRFAFFLNKLSPLYQKIQQQNVLVQNISTWFNVDKKTASQLLLSVPAIYTEFTDDNFVNKVATTNTVQFSRYQFIAKTCFIAGKLKLTETDLSFLIPHATDITSLNFLTLPLSAVATAVTTFPTFEALVNLLRFQQYYPAKIINNVTTSVYTIMVDAINQGVLTGTALTAYIANLVSNLSLLTGWNAADLTALISTPNYITLTLPADIKSVPILLRLHRRFMVLQQLGISATDAINWSKASLTIADSTKIKQVLKLKYTDTDWPEVAQPLQDKLREKKRDALIAYLLANPGTQNWKDENDLYSYFLLDVEMGSCQSTSRIVQATNSVQLFVQRCFLGLENFITIDSKEDASWLQWKWMKNFRVWQANVKTFLYPENWIEPELLPKDIKSSFLKELEDDLLQGEVTADSADTAFQNYLEKLDTIARLEVKGMWYDDNSRILHVFGRTYGGDPKTYYYRQFIDNSRWTPWERVDLDINSDHIVPVAYNNRLYLFWAVITSQNKQSATMMMSMPGTSPVPAPQPVLQWQIQLASSEYKNGKWTHSKTSDNNDAGQLLCDQSLFPDKSRFIFAPLDIPLADYADLFVFGGVLNPVLVPKDGFAALCQKIKAAILKNGTLMIGCYYYDPTLPANINAHKYISSFKLDVAKGYPVRTNFSIPYGFDGSLFSNKIVLNQQNMIFVEPTAPPSFQLYNTPTPSQSRGRFNKLVPFQMGAVSRMNYLQYLTEFTNFLSTGFLLPYFYQDQDRTYYVIPEYTNNSDFEFRYTDYVKFAAFDYLDSAGTYNQTTYAKLFSTTGVKIRDRFFNFFHPRMRDFMERLFLKGIDGLMERDTQLLGDPIYDATIKKFNFASYYNDLVATNTIYSGISNSGYPVEDVDFNQQSGYALYNWELFFHAPLMIAERLSQNHQFEAADRWYRYIFNPLDTSGYPSPGKYWNTKPFFINVNDKYTQQRIENVLMGIDNNNQDLIKDVTNWRSNPFQPHYIAQFRTVAYQKATVMKYVSHLIRHGDYLFSQHTMESVNEATQLYIMAAEILGPKPEVITPAGKTAVDNYFQLEQKLDSISNAMTDIENLLPFHSVTGYTNVTPQTVGLPSLQTLYFSIPMNENIAGPTGYWDTVADRLFKIRHCLDIDGNLAPLSLFSAPIDPGILVRATAAGLDIGAILNDLNVSLPGYRFVVMMQKAAELCNEVKTLGSLMLSILEKKDSEALGLLRSGHEIKLLGSVLLLKQQQIKDAQAAIDSLDKQRELITIRQQYYSGLFSNGLSTREKKALDLNKRSRDLTLPVQEKQKQSGLAAMLLPNFTFGQSGLSSPVTTFTVGGSTISKYYEMQASMLSAVAVNVDKEASMINTGSVYQRRAEEWQNQLNLANKELEQVQKQIESAQIKLDIALKDVSNQQLQIDQAKAANDFMQSKFTNKELFNWMVTQVSSTYFSSYQLAYEVAKKAERCFRYELGLADSAYINFGYWDSLKKGLLSGEQLSYDLKKMEMAYYEQNKRELELVKPISLSQLDPVALLKLKTTGQCWINLPEELFDMDYPGHYMRRIKSVSVTIPCIVGPYTTVSAKLTMTKNSVRTSGTSVSDPLQYPRKRTNGIPADDPRFRDDIGVLQSIATSSAQNDSGLFELNFRDERYLPFEGAGAISLWHMELPAAIRQFDYNTISDVIIHLKYTARDGGDALKANATTSLNTTINQMLVSLKDNGLMRIFSAKNDLSTEWYKFLHPVNVTDDQVFILNLDKNRFPLFVQNKTVKIKSVELVADSASPVNNIQVVAPAATAVSLNLTAAGIYGSNMSGSVDYGSSKKDPGTWLIKNPVINKRLTDNTTADSNTIKIDNMAVIVHYEVS